MSTQSISDRGNFFNGRTAPLELGNGAQLEEREEEMIYAELNKQKRKFHSISHNLRQTNDIIRMCWDTFSRIQWANWQNADQCSGPLKLRKKTTNKTWFKYVKNARNTLYSRSRSISSICILFRSLFSFCTSSLINISLNFQLDARSCLTCDKVLTELEKIDDDTDSFGVDFVKINDKRLAKQYGIKTFPALTYFR